MKGTEETIPHTKDYSKVCITMLKLDGVMNAMRLRRDEDISQETKVRPDVRMVELGIPLQEEG